MCGVKGGIEPMNTTLRILIVDDDDGIRTFLPYFLQRGMHFLHVATAENGFRALECLERALDKEQPFNIVISDFDMPKMNGAELLKKIQADERFNSVQFILMSSINALDDIPAEDRGRVVEFVSKPFSHAVMESALQKAAYEILMASR